MPYTDKNTSKKTTRFLGIIFRVTYIVGIFILVQLISKKSSTSQGIRINSRKIKDKNLTQNMGPQSGGRLSAGNRTEVLDSLPIRKLGEATNIGAYELMERTVKNTTDRTGLNFVG